MVPRRDTIDAAPGGQTPGNHAVLAVGIDAPDRLIVKNSWGPGWGDGGYGFVTPRYYDHTHCGRTPGAQRDDLRRAYAVAPNISEGWLAAVRMLDGVPAAKTIHLVPAHPAPHRRGSRPSAPPPIS